MKFLFSFLLGLFFVFFFFNSIAYPDEYSAEYKIEVGKINIGSVSWDVSLRENDYSTSISLKDEGVLSFVYKFEGKYVAQGRLRGDVLEAEYYSQFWKTKKKEREVKIFFENNAVKSLKLVPKEKELPRINYVGLNGHLDPLSSMLNILVGSESSKVIDGRRVYSMVEKIKKTSNKKNGKKLEIKDYTNIWADHKRNDLEYIEIFQEKTSGSFVMPHKIKIKFDGMVFVLTKN